MAKRGKKKGLRVDDVFNSAVQEGIYNLTKLRPGVNLEYISKHINQNAINEKIEEINERTYDIPEKQKEDYIKKELSEYVASGRMLDDSGKALILREGLEKKVGLLDKIRNVFVKPNSERYLDEVIDSFQDVYLLMKSGDYAQRMPELAEAVTTVNDLGFLRATIDVLKYRGVKGIQNKYTLFKKIIKEGIEESAEKAVGGIGKYIVPQQIQKAVAIILSFIGILFIGFSGNNITGDVIGNLPNTSLEITGVALILFSLILFLTRKRK